MPGHGSLFSNVLVDPNILTRFEGYDMNDLW